MTWKHLFYSVSKIDASPPLIPVISVQSYVKASRVASLLPLLPDPLWPEIVTIKILSMDQICLQLVFNRKTQYHITMCKKQKKPKYNYKCSMYATNQPLRIK